MTEQRITDDILPSLSEWFNFNCSTGCSMEQLKGTLLEAGYREADVDRFLEVQLSLWSAREAASRFDADPAGSADEAVRRFWSRLDVLDSFNQISLGDRTVRLLAKNINHGICFIPDFLSDEECRALIANSGISMAESLVLDEADGRHLRTASRSSRGGAIQRGANELVRRIESRISRLTALPVAHGEDLQLLQYGVGGEYRPHFDYFDPATEGGAQMLARGSQRLATVILYLCDVEVGGATLFPELSLAFTPMKGAALMFASLGPDGALLQSSLHCGCPVTSGEKWIATKWLRLAPHVPESAADPAQPDNR
jgi:prolyl 4-hydroxylase